MNKPVSALIIGVVATLIATSLIKYLPKLILTIKNIKMVKGFQLREGGVTGIWKDRHDEKAVKAVKEELKRATGEILLAGVAFPDFFRPNSIYINELSKLFKNSSISFRILLMDPKGDSAEEREKIEMGRFTILDIGNTIEYLKSVETQSKIMVNVYCIPPITFLIITNECLFIEQYHFGPPRVDLGCTGGQTIFLKLDKYSNTYRIMKQHFEYIWAKKSKEEIRRLQK